jgi:hypothetical protein
VRKPIRGIPYTQSFRHIFQTKRENIISWSWIRRGDEDVTGPGPIARRRERYIAMKPIPCQNISRLIDQYALRTKEDKKDQKTPIIKR